MIVEIMNIIQHFWDIIPAFFHMFISLRDTMDSFKVVSLVFWRNYDCVNTA